MSNKCNGVCKPTFMIYDKECPVHGWVNPDEEKTSAPPSPVGIELLDKLDNYIRQELMYQTEAGHQPREGLNKAYFNVIDAIETYKESSASLPQSSTEEEEDKMWNELIEDVEDGISQPELQSKFKISKR